MSGDEKKPILQDSGVYIKTSGSGNNNNQNVQQHLIIQPIEFDHKHRNMYGYLALGAMVLVLINYLMLKNRSCQLALVFFDGVSGYDYELIQGFHMTTIIVAIILFVLSYFNFAMVIHEFKLLFYASAALIFICSGLLIYNVVAITSAPCVAIGNEGLISLMGVSGVLGQGTNIFSAHDGIGITVFVFDILAAILMFFAGRRFYQRS